MKEGYDKWLHNYNRFINDIKKLKTKITDEEKRKRKGKEVLVAEYEAKVMPFYNTLENNK